MEAELVNDTKPSIHDVTTTSAKILKNENISAIHLILPTDSTHFGGDHNKTVEMGNGGSSVMPFGITQQPNNIGSFKTGNTGKVDAAPIFNDENSEVHLVKDGVVISFNTVINNFGTGYKDIFQQGSDRYFNRAIIPPLEISKITSKLISCINKTIFQEVNRQEFTQPSQSVIFSPTGETEHSGSVPVNVVNLTQNFLEPGSSNFTWDTKPSTEFMSKPYENTESILFPNLPERPVSHSPFSFEWQGKYLDSITYNHSDTKPDYPKIPASSDNVYTNVQPRQGGEDYLNLMGPGEKVFPAQAGHDIQNFSSQNRTKCGKPDDYMNQFGLKEIPLNDSKPGKFYFQNYSESRVIDFPDILCDYRPYFQILNKTESINSNFHNHTKTEVTDLPDIFVNNRTGLPSHIGTGVQDLQGQSATEKVTFSGQSIPETSTIISGKDGPEKVPFSSQTVLKRVTNKPVIKPLNKQLVTKRKLNLQPTKPPVKKRIHTKPFQIVQIYRGLKSANYMKRRKHY